MEVEASSSSRRSKKRKKEKKDHRSRSKSKKKHHKRQKRSSPSPDRSVSEEKSEDLLRLTREQADRSLSHQEAVNLVRNTLDSLLSTDELLNDLPPAVTVEEVQSLIELEHGQAIQIQIAKEDGTFLPVIVKPDTTVGNLKRAVQRATELKLKRDPDFRRRRISWKYIWKTYWLFAHGNKLKDDGASLKEYGIKSNDSISFLKRLNDK